MTKIIWAYERNHDALVEIVILLCGVMMPGDQTCSLRIDVVLEIMDYGYGANKAQATPPPLPPPHVNMVVKDDRGECMSRPPHRQGPVTTSMASKKGRGDHGLLKEAGNGRRPIVL